MVGFTMHRRTSPGLPKGKMNLLGGRLQAMRMTQNWTQLQMVMRLRRRGWQIELATLARIETGQRSIADNELKLLLNALGKKWSDLD